MNSAIDPAEPVMLIRGHTPPGQAGLRVHRPDWIRMGSWMVALASTVCFCTVRAEQPQDPNLNLEQIHEYIEALGASEFAVRERAADTLVSLGIEVVPLLAQARENTADPEVKLRAKKLISQLRSGSMEARIESFLAGDAVGFENWGIIKAIFGDLPKSRDLYVELLQTYPELVSALDGTTRELVLAMDSVSEKIRTNRTKFGWQPRVSDAVAMLLPATDESVPVGLSYENDMLYLMQLAPVTRVPKDNVLGPPFARLLGTWMDRSQAANRQAIIFFAMEWDLRAAYVLAMRTLDDTTDTETLATAMQAIAKHGSKKQTAFLLPFLDDKRTASQRRFVRGRAVDTELRDVAVVTIAILNEVPMKEIGLDESVKHDKYGFIYEEVGFPKGDAKSRDLARKRIEQVIGRGVKEIDQGS